MTDVPFAAPAFIVRDRTGAAIPRKVAAQYFKIDGAGVTFYNLFEGMPVFVAYFSLPIDVQRAEPGND